MDKRIVVSNTVFGKTKKPLFASDRDPVMWGYGIFWIEKIEGSPIHSLNSFPHNRCLGFRGFGSFKEAAQYFSHIGEFVEKTVSSKETFKSGDRVQHYQGEIILITSEWTTDRDYVKDEEIETAPFSAANHYVVAEADLKEGEKCFVFEDHRAGIRGRVKPQSHFYEEIRCAAYSKHEYNWERSKTADSINPRIN